MIYGPGMMGGYFGGLGILWMIIMFIFIAAFIVGIILLIVWAVRRSSYHMGNEPQKSSSMEVLKERYAKGDITKDEYEKIKKDIT